MQLCARNGYTNSHKISETGQGNTELGTQATETDWFRVVGQRIDSPPLRESGRCQGRVIVVQVSPEPGFSYRSHENNFARPG